MQDFISRFIHFYMKRIIIYLNYESRVRSVLKQFEISTTVCYGTLYAFLEQSFPFCARRVLILAYVSQIAISLLRFYARMIAEDEIAREFSNALQSRLAIFI